MRIRCLQHVPFEGPAHLATIAREREMPLATTRLFAGEPLPGIGEFDLLAVMGGPMGVHDDAIYPWLADEKRMIESSIRAGKRVLGICLGAQLIADVLGARVFRNRHREIGWFPVRRAEEAGACAIGRSLPDRFHAFHWHGDTFDIPTGAIRIAESDACRNQGFVWKDRVAALQFHLEATPESVSALLDNCGDELDGSEFVQARDAILETGHVPGCNRLFEAILDHMTIRG
jgi:GMP synthase-like glutamine amidotransferase